jgi:acyl-CoA thioester hydrolase
MAATERPVLTEYLFHSPLTTRWSDNDLYGHINNVAYYNYFDSVINLYLIEVGGLDILHGAAIGLVVESHCQFHAPLAYPTPLVAGLRVDRLGNRAVTYGIAIFAEGEDTAAAHGHVVHVFVDRGSRKPVAIPPPLRDALARLCTS